MNTIKKDTYSWHPALEPFRACNKDPVAFDDLISHCINLGNSPSKLYVWLSDSGVSQVLSPPNEVDAYFVGYPWGELDVEVITSPDKAVALLLKSTEDWANASPIHISSFHLALKNWLSSVSPPKPKVTDETLSKLLNISRSSLTNSIRLQRLAPKVQEYIEIGAIDITQAKTMISLPHVEQIRFAKMSVQRAWSTRDLHAAVFPDSKNIKSSQGKFSTPDIVRFNRVISESSGLDVTFEGSGELLNKGVLRINFGTIGELERLLDLVTGGSESQIQKGTIVLDIENLNQVESLFSKLMR
jgi:predicted DNA-binding protein (MmcQ/YjbR family)